MVKVIALSVWGSAAECCAVLLPRLAVKQPAVTFLGLEIEIELKRMICWGREESG